MLLETPNNSSFSFFAISAKLIVVLNKGIGATAGRRAMVPLLHLNEMRSSLDAYLQILLNHQEPRVEPHLFCHI